MTLNQIVNRIKLVATSHNQVRSFKRSLVSDFNVEHTIKYPAVHLFDTGGTVSTSSHVTIINFQMLILDLVHASADAMENEGDVYSDTLSIALDFIAQYKRFPDWRLEDDPTIQLKAEQTGDRAFGVQLDFSIKVPYTENICEVPTELEDFTPIDDTDMKLVYDEKYTATGSEGTTLSIPALAGKKIIFASRENSVIYKVSNAPDPAEYTWNNTLIELGTVTNPGERFLFLYRNY